MQTKDKSMNIRPTKLESQVIFITVLNRGGGGRRLELARRDQSCFRNYGVWPTRHFRVLGMVSFQCP